MALKIVIIGAGPGGYAAAVRAAEMGGEVTVVDSDRIGGTCLNRGCIPSKVMKTTAEMLDLFRRGREFGIHVGDRPEADMPGLVARKNNVVQSQATGMLALLKRRRIAFLQGQAEIHSGGRLEVRQGDDVVTTLAWDRLIIAVGSRPRSLPFAPFDGKRMLSSDHILDLDHVPGSVVIIGGGVIGCEFAFILSALGAQVTVVEELARLLPIPAVDESCAGIIQREMKKRKIDVFVQHRAHKVEDRSDTIRIWIAPTSVSSSGSQQDLKGIEADMLLTCIGRAPSTNGLGLANIGVATDEAGWIIADETMATGVPGVYAIGDILGPSKIMLAHAAAAEGIVAAENAMGNTKRMQYDLIPSAIFTMPEVADVGLTEDQATASGREVCIDRFLFRQLGKAHVIGQIAGEVKLVSEKSGGRILGVHIVGAHATDLISEGVLALKTGCTVRDLAETIHPHPTLSEGLMEAAMARAYPRSSD